MDGFTGPLIVKGLNKSRLVETPGPWHPCSAFQLRPNRHTQTQLAPIQTHSTFSALRNAVVTWITPELIYIHLGGKKKRNRQLEGYFFREGLLKSRAAFYETTSHPKEVPSTVNLFFSQLKSTGIQFVYIF